MNNKITETERILKTNLTLLRKAKGLTKKIVATDLNIDYSYLHRLENLERTNNPSYEILEKFATYFNVPVYYLFCPPEKWN